MTKNYKPLDNFELTQLKAALDLIPDDTWNIVGIERVENQASNIPDLDDLPLICNMPGREKRLIAQVESLQSKVFRQERLLNFFFEDYKNV